MFTLSPGDLVKNCIGTIVGEILAEVTRAPAGDIKEPYIHKLLDKFFDNVDLTESFTKIQTIIYDEVLTVEILLALNSWLNKQSCNVDNIELVTTHTLGLPCWFTNYKNLFGIRGVKIKELPLVSRRYNERLNSVRFAEFQPRTFDRYFTLYSGSRSNLESDFIAGLFLNLENKGLVDYIGQFTTDKVVLENYIEQLTGFKNKELVDSIVKSSYKMFSTNDKTINELFDNTGFQYYYDSQAPIQIVRETINSTPWLTITEKTLRPFLHRQFPILLSGSSSVALLESYGFKFDYRIIDHNRYQYINNFPDRSVAIHNLVNTVTETFSLSALEQHYIDCAEIIDYNYNYIFSQQFFNTVEEKFIKNTIND